MQCHESHCVASYNSQQVTVLIPLWSSTISIPGDQRKLANCTKARSSWGKSCLLTSSIEYQQYFVADSFKVYFQQCISNALSIFFWLKIKITLILIIFTINLAKQLKSCAGNFLPLATVPVYKLQCPFWAAWSKQEIKANRFYATT